MGFSRTCAADAELKNSWNEDIAQTNYHNPLTDYRKRFSNFNAEENSCKC